MNINYKSICPTRIVVAIYLPEVELLDYRQYKPFDWLNTSAIFVEVTHQKINLTYSFFNVSMA